MSSDPSLPAAPPSSPPPAAPPSSPPRPLRGLAALKAAGVVTTPGPVSGQPIGQPTLAPGAVEPARHAMFAPIAPERQAQAQAALALRQALTNAAKVAEATRRVIATAMPALKAATPAVLEAEGIDLDLVSRFDQAIADALQLTQPQG